MVPLGAPTRLFDLEGFPIGPDPARRPPHLAVSLDVLRHAPPEPGELRFFLERHQGAVELDIAAQSVFVFTERKADAPHRFEYLIRQWPDAHIVDSRPELARRPHTVLGFPIHHETDERVHDVSVRIHT